MQKYNQTAEKFLAQQQQQVTYSYKKLQSTFLSRSPFCSPVSEIISMLLNATCEIPASGNAIKGFLEGKKAGCVELTTEEFRKSTRST